MRAVIVGAGMGGLMTALALRQSGVFASVNVYEHEGAQHRRRRVEHPA